MVRFTVRVVGSIWALENVTVIVLDPLKEVVTPPDPARPEISTRFAVQPLGRLSVTVPDVFEGSGTTIAKEADPGAKVAEGDGDGLGDGAWTGAAAGPSGAAAGVEAAGVASGVVARGVAGADVCWGAAAAEGLTAGSAGGNELTCACGCFGAEATSECCGTGGVCRVRLGDAPA